MCHGVRRQRQREQIACMDDLERCQCSTQPIRKLLRAGFGSCARLSLRCRVISEESALSVFQSLSKIAFEAHEYRVELERSNVYDMYFDSAPAMARQLGRRNLLESRCEVLQG